MSKVSRALAILDKVSPRPWNLCNCGVCSLVWANDGMTIIHDQPKNEDVVQTQEQARMDATLIHAAPDMAALLLRCKPWIEDSLKREKLDLSWLSSGENSRESEDAFLKQKKVDELSSILAEMNGEEKKDE